MFATVCPVCKNKFYSEKVCIDGNPALHSYCVWSEDSNDQLQKNPVRTSTPIAELENGSSNFADSVTDFFYQSWKSGLHSNDTFSKQKLPEYRNNLFRTDAQQVCYTPQVVCFNTVIYQAFAQCAYMQPVGYRPDGTFGFLPACWGYFGN